MPRRELRAWGAGGVLRRAVQSDTNGARVCFLRQVNVYVLGKTFLLLARELCINAPAIGTAGKRARQPGKGAAGAHVGTWRGGDVSREAARSPVSDSSFWSTTRTWRSVPGRYG